MSMCVPGERERGRSGSAQLGGHARLTHAFPRCAAKRKPTSCTLSVMGWGGFARKGGGWWVGGGGADTCKRASWERARACSPCPRPSRSCSNCKPRARARLVDSCSTGRGREGGPGRQGAPTGGALLLPNTLTAFLCSVSRERGRVPREPAPARRLLPLPRPRRYAQEWQHVLIGWRRRARKGGKRVWQGGHRKKGGGERPTWRILQ